MNRITLSLILCTLVGATSCSGPAKDEGAEFNPKREFWHSVALQTDYFSESCASKSEWEAKADQCKEVTGEDQLENILDTAGLQASQKRTALLLFSRGYTTLHVGFWDRFQALVFFEKDSAKVIMKW